MPTHFWGPLFELTATSTPDAESRLRHLSGPKTGSSLPFRDPGLLSALSLTLFCGLCSHFFYRRAARVKDGEHGADISHECAWDNPNEIIFISCVLRCLEIDLPFFPALEYVYDRVRN